MHEQQKAWQRLRDRAAELLGMDREDEENHFGITAVIVSGLLHVSAGGA